MIMFTGVAVLGLLAGSLASFFGLGTATSTGPPTVTSDPTEPPDVLTTEIVELRTQVARLVDEVARLATPDTAPPTSPNSGLS